MPRYLLRKDMHDERDHVFARLTLSTSLPVKLDLRSQCSPVVDQGELGSCTANAIASGLREYMEIKAGQSLTLLSRLYLYYKEREAEGTVDQDAGASIRDGMKILSKQGVCPEIDWPYNIARFAQAPPPKADVDALNYKVSSYQRLASIQDIKRCIYEGFPVVFGFTVFESMESAFVARTGIVPMPKSWEQKLGGHAVLAVGYEDTGKSIFGRSKGDFIVRNSWGTSWGDKGYCYMPYEFINNYAFDFWTAR